MSAIGHPSRDGYREPVSATPPPGLYIDPDDPNRQRFWNGTAWTDHVMPLDGDTSSTAMYAPLPKKPHIPPQPPAPPPGSLPTPDAADAVPAIPPPLRGPYASTGNTPRGLPMEQRPLSQAAMWSLLLALFCPFVGAVFAVVALGATGPQGDRRGRVAAVIGLVLCLASAFGGLVFAMQSGQVGASGT
jgi:hypothetical protein